MLLAVVAEGRQKVEDCRHLVDFSVDDIRRTLDAPGLELFPWLFLGLFLMVREVSGVVTLGFICFVEHCTVDFVSPLVGS